MKNEYEYTDKIMGTDLAVSIICLQSKVSDDIFKNMHKDLKDYELKFSRFLSESELSILNDKKELTVSGDFLEVIMESKKLFHETAGYFNPLFQISRYGYDRSFALINDRKSETKQNAIQEKYDTDFDSVKIDTQNSKVTLNANQKLDFGGFLKGYLAEKMARKYFLHDLDVSGIIVNIGGDIYTLGRAQDDSKFFFSIYNPVTDKEDLNLTVADAGLATSGVYKRKWSIDGKSYHHILDKTGRNNTDGENISISVVCESGGRADAYTKILMSAGIDEAIKTLNNEKLKYLIIKNNGKIIKNI